MAMKRFYLAQQANGEGIVGEGVEFTTGRVAMLIYSNNVTQMVDHMKVVENVYGKSLHILWHENDVATAAPKAQAAPAAQPFPAPQEEPAAQPLANGHDAGAGADIIDLKAEDASDTKAPTRGRARSRKRT